MLGVLSGFLTVGLIIALGFFLAHVKLFDTDTQKMLARLAFFVASPALMIHVLGDTDVRQLFSANLIASMGSVTIVATITILLARLVWHRNGSDTVIATFSACYVNAGNLGLPIAAYVLHDASYIAPMLLTQLLILQPLGVAVLDMTLTKPQEGDTTARRIGRMLLQPFRNPLMIGSLIGLLLSVFDIDLPDLIRDPLTLVGGIAVPGMLIAYGISLRLGPLPGSGEPKSQIGTIVALKIIVQPLVAYLIARFLLGLEGIDIFAVVIVAALPTAQNVFTHAVRYDRGVIIARDSIILTTFGAIPVLILSAALLA